MIRVQALMRTRVRPMALVRCPVKATLRGPWNSGCDSASRKPSRILSREHNSRLFYFPDRILQIENDLTQIVSLSLGTPIGETVRKRPRLSKIRYSRGTL